MARRVWLRRGIYFAILIVTAGVMSALRARRHKLDTASPIDGDIHIAVVAQPAHTIFDVPPAEMAEAIAAPDPIPPDRRILLAVATVHHLLVHDEGGDVIATARGAQWFISYDHDSVGMLPDLPSYADADSLLTRWAVRLVATHPLPPPRVGSDSGDFRWRLTIFTLPRTIAVLARMDTLWRRAPDASLLPVAASAAARLWLQTVDEGEVGDLAGANALAVVTVATAVTKQPLVAEHVLTASGLGYTVEAAQMARALASDDPVRLYTEDYPDTLFQIANDSGASGFTRYLALRRSMYDSAAEAHAYEAFVAGLDPLLVADATLTAENGWLNEYAPSYTVPLVLSMVRQTMGVSDDARPPSDTLDEIDADTRRVGRYLSGPFLTGDTYRAVVRAHLTTALDVRCTTITDDWADAPAARAWAARVARGMPKMGGDVGRVCADIATARTGTQNWLALLADLSPTVAIGHSMRSTLVDEIGRADPTGGRRLDVAVDSVRATFDSRPNDLAELAYLVHWRGTDLARVQALHEREAQLMVLGGSAADIGLMDFLGDAAGLMRVADDTTAQLVMREEAFQTALTDTAMPPATAAAYYTAYLRADPQNDSLAMSAAHYLVAHGDRPAAVALLQNALVDNVDTTDDDVGNPAMRGELARMLVDEGRLSDAWAAVGPVATSGQGVAMSAAALTLEYHNKRADADSLSRWAFERYPNYLTERAIRMEVLWDQGRWADAADVFADSAAAIRTWETVDGGCHALIHELPRMGLSGVRHAGFALLRTPIDPYRVTELADQCAAAGHPDIAAILDALPIERPHHAEEPMMAQSSAYKYLTLSAGHDSAVRYLQSVGWETIDWSKLGAIYKQQAFGAMWDFPPAPDVGSSFWLMRAAGELRSTPNPAHRAALLAYYQSPQVDTTDPYIIMGRYLVGLADAPALFALVHGRDSHRRCEIAYYLAVRAESERRWTDALNWYRVSVATNSTRDGEWNWASDRLNGWTAASKSLAALTRGR